MAHGALSNELNDMQKGNGSQYLFRSWERRRIWCIGLLWHAFGFAIIGFFLPLIEEPASNTSLSGFDILNQLNHPFRQWTVEMGERETLLGKLFIFFISVFPFVSFLIPILMIFSFTYRQESWFYKIILIGFVIIVYIHGIINLYLKNGWLNSSYSLLLINVFPLFLPVIYYINFKIMPFIAILIIVLILIMGSIFQVTGLILAGGLLVIFGFKDLLNHNISGAELRNTIFKPANKYKLENSSTLVKLKFWYQMTAWLTFGYFIHLASLSFPKFFAGSLLMILASMIWLVTSYLLPHLHPPALVNESFREEN